MGLPERSTGMVREGETLPRHPGRDPDFREAVLRAYERRCAVCDFDLRIADMSFGLEAAHIMWPSHGGPPEVPNGLALCTFHHKAFDRGVIGLEPESGEYRVLVSNELSWAESGLPRSTRPARQESPPAARGGAQAGRRVRGLAPPTGVSRYAPRPITSLTNGRAALAA